MTATGLDPATADATARDAIRQRLGETLFVEAGAGTGKTTALVGRILELVRDGTAMRAIAAITFTEAAAAELRERVRRELERAAPTDPYFAKAAAEVDEATIATLHGFAQRILAENPLEAGLPPAIEVMDEIESSLAFDEQWRAFVDELVDDPAYEAVLLRALACGLSNFEGLRAVAWTLHDHRDRLVVGAPAPEALPSVDLRPVRHALAAAATYADYCLDDDDLMAGHLAKVAVDAERLTAIGDDELAALAFLSERYWRFTYGQRDKWATDIQAIRDACAAAEDARAACIGQVKSNALAHALHALVGFTQRTAADRRATGRLDFHDLLVESRDLLRRRADVRRALRDRFAYLLVDEFQDTDPIQVELAVLIAADETGGDGGVIESWHDVSVAPGRLFFVGDPKQSIYRFRRADVKLFLAVRDQVADAVVQLTTNFRSVPGVIEWINTLFASIIGEGVEGAQARYEPLVPRREALLGPGPVVMLGGSRDAALGDIRELEARDIADAVVRAVEQEAWLVEDPDTKQVRPAHYRDVAILLPTRVTLPYLEAALDDAEIPYRVESSSLVWSTQEISDLLAVLRVIDDPTDEVALVAALRSPAFACRDRELLEFRNAGGRWNLRSDCPPALAEHPVCRGLDELRAFHERRWWEGVAATVDRVVRELNLYHLAFAHSRPRDRWRRLRFVVDQARAFEEAGGRTMRAFLVWAERQAADDARVREPILPESDDDAVRLLTVHGAKGLEFPIVVLTGLNRAVGGGGGPTVHWVDDRPEVRVNRFETPGFANAAAANKELENYEQIRLLYVAATRARDHLVISIHHKATAGAGRTHAAVVAEHAERCPELWRRLGEPLFRLQPPSAGRAPVADPSAETNRQLWSAARSDDVARLRRAPVAAATAIAARAAGALDDAVEATAADAQLDAPPWRRGRAGTAIGRAVHAVLQSIDLATGADLDRLAAAQAAAEGIDRHAGEIAALARAALSAPVVAEAMRGRHWRELYVAAPIGDVLVEGYIDLAFEAGDEFVIVDYKTDAVVSDADIDAAVPRYRLQLGAYALAVEAALGRPVERGILLFLASDGARPRQITDLGAAAEEVRALLGRR